MGQKHQLRKSAERMQINQYYRLVDDLVDDEGVVYYEVSDNQIIRQVILVHGRIYWADENDEAEEAYGFPDHLEFIESEIPEFCCLETLSASEFEVLWEQGKAQWE